MRILEIGGSGFVGGLINPYLCQHHEVRIYDRVPPKDEGMEYVEGSVLSSEKLAAAAEGMESIIYLAMGKDLQGRIEEIASSYDVNVEGVHRALEAAADAGVRRAVYASTLSIYDRPHGDRTLDSEDQTGDAHEIYGFTKRLGEEVCEYFARSRSLSCIVLRLNSPSTEERWKTTPSASLYGVTCASDLARAFEAAVTCEHTGYTSIFITGDHTERVCSLARARKILGWEPSVWPGSGNEEDQG